MHYKLLHPNDYMGAPDLQDRDVHVEIASIIPKHELTMEGNKKSIKPVLTFKGATKMMVLNKTNAKTIAKLLGKDTDKWIGQSITLYPTETRYGAEMVECVRVRAAKPQTQRQPDEAPPDMTEAEMQAARDEEQKQA